MWIVERIINRFIVWSRLLLTGHHHIDVLLLITVLNKKNTCGSYLPVVLSLILILASGVGKPADTWEGARCKVYRGTEVYQYHDTNGT